MNTYPPLFPKPIFVMNYNGRRYGGPYSLEKIVACATHGEAYLDRDGIHPAERREWVAEYAAKFVDHAVVDDEVMRKLMNYLIWLALDSNHGAAIVAGHFLGFGVDILPVGKDGHFVVPFIQHEEGVYVPRFMPANDNRRQMKKRKRL